MPTPTQHTYKHLKHKKQEKKIKSQEFRSGELGSHARMLKPKIWACHQSESTGVSSLSRIDGSVEMYQLHGHQGRQI